MSCSVYQVDTFTTTPFAGNPAAVCLLASDRSNTWMQNVAAEMSLSETAFLHPQANGGFQLRWFTPTHEVALCGHATLASAHVLWTEGIASANAPIQFDTKGGPLSATQHKNGITLDFPTDPPSPIDAPDSLLDGLNVSPPTYVGQTDRDYFVQVPSEEDVRFLSPDLRTLATLDPRGVIVTAPSDGDDSDFVSRFFAPGVGVPEDPVTGSAHCALGPYWAKRLKHNTLTGRQLSDRGGIVHLHLDTPDADRIKLRGQATTVLHGRLSTPNT